MSGFALSGCDIFNNNDDETPTSPLQANVVVVGDVSVQATDDGLAEYLGALLSNGSVTANNVRVSINIFDANNGLIDVASSTAVPSSLAPNQAGTFKVTSTTAIGDAIRFEVVIEWD